MTASELMKDQANKQQAKVTQLGRAYLSGNLKYDYCPYCVKEAKQKNIEYKEFCRPLAIVTYCTWAKMTNADGTTSPKKIIDKCYECAKCGRKMSEFDWVLNYCMRADGTKYNEPVRKN